MRKWDVWFLGAKIAGPAGAAPADIYVCIEVVAQTIGAALLRAETIMATWKNGHFDCYQIAENNIREEKTMMHRLPSRSPATTTENINLFRLKDIVVWATPWNTFFLGEIQAKFVYEGVPSLLCLCVGDIFVDRDTPFKFIAAEKDCKAWLGEKTKDRPELVIPALVPSKY